MGLPAPHSYGKTGYVSRHEEHGKARPTTDKDTQGKDYCTDVAISARQNANHHRSAGWILGGFALGFAGTGVVVASSAQPTDTAGSNRYKAVVAAAPLAAALLAYVATSQFAMADNSLTLASASTSAVNLDDKEANIACNTSLAEWETGSKSTAKAFADAVQALRRDAEERKKARDAAFEEGRAQGRAEKPAPVETQPNQQAVPPPPPPENKTQ
jgi:hypothetical protein